MRLKIAKIKLNKMVETTEIDKIAVTAPFEEELFLIWKNKTSRSNS
jgi:hypothetical protein